MNELNCLVFILSLLFGSSRLVSPFGGMPRRVWTVPNVPNVSPRVSTVLRRVLRMPGERISRQTLFQSLVLLFTVFAADAPPPDDESPGWLASSDRSCAVVTCAQAFRSSLTYDPSRFGATAHFKGLHDGAGKHTKVTLRMLMKLYRQQTSGVFTDVALLLLCD